MPLPSEGSICSISHSLSGLLSPPAAPSPAARAGVGLLPSGKGGASPVLPHSRSSQSRSRVPRLALLISLASFSSPPSSAPRSRAPAGSPWAGAQSSQLSIELSDPLLGLPTPSAGVPPPVISSGPTTVPRPGVWLGAGSPAVVACPVPPTVAAGLFLPFGPPPLRCELLRTRLLLLLIAILRVPLRPPLLTGFLFLSGCRHSGASCRRHVVHCHMYTQLQYCIHLYLTNPASNGIACLLVPLPCEEFAKKQHNMGNVKAWLAAA